MPSLPGFGFPGPLAGFSDINFWKVSDLWHTLMTEACQLPGKQPGLRLDDVAVPGATTSSMLDGQYATALGFLRAHRGIWR